MTMLNTPVLSLDYPDGSEPPNLTTLLQALALSVEAAVGAAWTAYAPVATNMPAPTSMQGRYLKIGRTVIGHIDIVMSGAPTGIVGLTLPVAMSAPPANSKPVVGSCFVVDVSAGNYFGGVIHLQGDNLTTRPMFPASLSSSTNDLGWMAAALPFAWASGDTLSLNFTYEAAS